ncbi:PadR family transcriptional regulator, partial [Staphylococcus aureus]
LSKKGYVDTTIKKSSNGGTRRQYYTITDSGLKELKVFKSKWQVLNKGMINLFGGENDVKLIISRFFRKITC